jgi:hypothetical protein
VVSPLRASLVRRIEATTADSTLISTTARPSMPVPPASVAALKLAADRALVRRRGPCDVRRNRASTSVGHLVRVLSRLDTQLTPFADSVEDILMSCIDVVHVVAEGDAVDHDGVLDASLCPLR